MKDMKSFSQKSVIFCLFFLGSIGAVFAQAGNKGVYNTAVDQVNCATIGFIHRENGRAEAANNMDCLSFESINKSIPADETKTTGALCKSINEYKNKFKDDKPLDAQLSALISFATVKIVAKKRKGNVEDFKASLEKIKKEALENAGGAKPTDKPAAGTAPNTPGSVQQQQEKPADSSQAITEPTADPASKSGRKTDWLGILSLLVALGGLGLAYMAYSKAKKIENNGSGTGNTVNTGGATAAKEAMESAMREIKRIENKLNSDMANLARKMDEKASASVASASTMASPAHKEPEKEPVKTTPQEEKRPEPAPVVHMEPSASTAPVFERAKEPEIKKEPEALQPDPEAPLETAAQHFEEKPQPPVDLFASRMQEEEMPVQGHAAPHREEAAATPSAEPFMPEKEYEDGEAVPFYKYAGLPDEDGFFSLQSFTNDPVKDSVYEIEMYEDVPNKAFFSLLPNPEVIRRALLEPEIYLAPCCSYTTDPEGKRTIVLVEEGMLRKQEDKWMIYEKAKINFE
jgi:hypothetical protein